MGTFFTFKVEGLERKYKLESSGMDVDKIAKRVARLLKMTVDEVWSVGKYRRVVKARSLLCYWAVRELGISMTSLSRRLAITPAAIAQSVLRGERLARENGYELLSE
jgi:chromosomal replication initiation ATPase DnaA